MYGKYVGELTSIYHQRAREGYNPVVGSCEQSEFQYEGQKHWEWEGQQMSEWFRSMP